MLLLVHCVFVCIIHLVKDGLTMHKLKYMARQGPSARHDPLCPVGDKPLAARCVSLARRPWFINDELLAKAAAGTFFL